MHRRALLALPVLLLPGRARAQARLVPVAADHPAGAALVARLRQGGLVLFFRHADTIGMPCDASFRLGDRAGQRNISPDGIAQSRRIGERLAALGIPLARPVLAGPVYRARDTAEHAFGAADVVVTDSLLADDYAGARLGWVLDEHRRLFSAPVPPATNRVLVGHRTPAIMVAGDKVAGRAFPEGAARVIAPGSAGFVAPQGARSEAPQGARSEAPQGARPEAPQGARSEALQGARSEAPQGARSDMPQGARFVAPEGARFVAPEGARFEVLGILELAPLAGRGFHAC